MNLWFAQILAVIRLEWKKTFFARRGFWIYILALMPLALFTIHTIFDITRHHSSDFGESTNIFATVFQFFYLRLAIFFGCVGIFMNLIRGEMLDRSLHFYFLAPIRREVLMAGKFLAGLFAAAVIFGTSTILQLVAVYADFDPPTIQEFVYRGDGLHHLFAYLGVTVLACVGYGSVFLAAGVLMRNPIIPAAIMLVWESINSFLPAFLQKFSIIYYLKSLCPVEVPPQVPPPFALLAVNPDPASPLVAIPSLILLSALVVLWSGYKIRRLEISYSTD
jgi:ABC-type transport system involved in multi-copper enzyme maturation permease subunit